MSGTSTPSRKLSSTMSRTTPPRPAEGLLMQFRPSAGAGLEDEQTDRLAAVAQGQHEQAGAAVLATLRVADHGAGAVIHLGFFTGRGHDHGVSLRDRCAAELADKAPHALIAAGEAGLRNQILPDGHGVAATGQTQFDQLAIRFTGTGGGTARGRPGTGAGSAPGPVITSSAAGGGNPCGAPRTRSVTYC